MPARAMLNAVGGALARFQENKHRLGYLWSAGAGLNDHVHADQVRQRLRAHLVHDVAAMDFDGAFAQAQVECDDLVGAAQPVDGARQVAGRQGMSAPCALWSVAARAKSPLQMPRRALNR